MLILRDVLGWRAAEVAGLLGTTTVAANSALQRARAQLQEAGLTENEIREPADPGDLALLNRYAAAFENAGIAALTELLRKDAVLEMPPLPGWFAGREHAGRAFGVQVLTVSATGIARITAFLDPGLPVAFGFPPELRN